MQLMLILIGLLNLWTFGLYGVDKRKAIKHKYRINEKTLLLNTLTGPLGAGAGMLLFHHKTKKYYFVLTVLLGLIVNGVAAYFWVPLFL